MLSIKDKIKSIYPVEYLNFLINSYLQEKRAENELRYYKNKAYSLGLNIPKEEELSGLIKKRLSQRGLCVKKKNKGDLHIISNMFITYH